MKDKKIIKRIIEIRKLYGYGKFKIKKQLELEAIKVGTTAIETVLKENNLYRSKKKKIKRKHKGKHAIYIKEVGEKVQIDVTLCGLRHMLFLVKYAIINLLL